MEPVFKRDLLPNLKDTLDLITQVEAVGDKENLVFLLNDLLDIAKESLAQAAEKKQ